MTLQVTIDSQGMLKAVHLVSMTGAETPNAAAPISYSAMPGSQVSMAPPCKPLMACR